MKKITSASKNLLNRTIFETKNPANRTISKTKYPSNIKLNLGENNA
jgi:hypothetical protein